VIIIQLAIFDAVALHRRPTGEYRTQQDWLWIANLAIVIMIKLATFDAVALHRPVDREREAIVIMIKLAIFDADALHTPCGSRTRSDRDNDQTRNI